MTSECNALANSWNSTRLVFCNCSRKKEASKISEFDVIYGSSISSIKLSRTFYLSYSSLRFGRWLFSPWKTFTLLPANQLAVSNNFMAKEESEILSCSWSCGNEERKIF